MGRCLILILFLLIGCSSLQVKPKLNHPLTPIELHNLIVTKVPYIDGVVECIQHVQIAHHYLTLWGYKPQMRNSMNHEGKLHAYIRYTDYKDGKIKEILNIPEFYDVGECYECRLVS